MTIPNRAYWYIGQVAELLKVQIYEIRAWEKTFGMQVRRTRAGQRLFTSKQVRQLVEVKRMIYEERYTLEGARIAWEDRKRALKALKIPASSKESPAERLATIMREGAGDLDKLAAELRELAGMQERLERVLHTEGPEAANIIGSLRRVKETKEALRHTLAMCRRA